ncbi:MAG: fibronectin type III domain-containing protein [Candidatus Zixiibacteriota bacterium]|nr:MAG: fibronectin type III domain-containing protein [candidate division Zixibacteria bacterium]
MNQIIKRRVITRLSSIVIIKILFLSLPVVAEQLIPTIDDSVEAFIPAPPAEVIATDAVYDQGGAVHLEWQLSPDDDGSAGVYNYQICRQQEGTDEYIPIDSVLAGVSSYIDETVEPGRSYQYIVAVNGDCGSAPSEASNVVTPNIEWLNFGLSNLFVIGLIICGSVIYFIAHAKRGKKLFIRRIAGLEAVDEAIGRATEMGRPILFVPGILDMDDVQTIAALTILGRVSRVVADYDTKISVPVSRSLVMTAARETLKASYMAAGRPDAYSDDMASYITDEQFGYVAAVDGKMVREKPATCFLLGAFFAESLILAETGNSIGAIQIAGTARPAQLPFFVAACDFTLIGEELFAASAYLSGEPKQMGSLKGQDVGKGIAMIIILLGVIATTFGNAWNISLLRRIADFLRTLFEVG